MLTPDHRVRDKQTSALSEALILGSACYSGLTLCSQISCEAEEECAAPRTRKDSRAGDMGQGERSPEREERD